MGHGTLQPQLCLMPLRWARSWKVTPSILTISSGMTQETAKFDYSEGSVKTQGGTPNLIYGQLICF